MCGSLQGNEIEWSQMNEIEWSQMNEIELNVFKQGKWIENKLMEWN